MKVTQEEHEVEVVFRAVRRALPRLRVQLPDVHTEDPETGQHHRLSGFDALLLFGVLTAFTLALTPLALLAEESAPIDLWLVVLSAVSMAAPWGLGLLWVLSRSSILEWRETYRTHTLNLGPAGARLDGVPCDVRMEFDRLITGDDRTCRVAESPRDLAELRWLVEPTTRWSRERAGDPGDVPPWLRSAR